MLLVQRTRSVVYHRVYDWSIIIVVIIITSRGLVNETVPAIE